MIRVSQSLLQALEASMDRGWFNYRELEEQLGGRDKAFYTLLEGFSLGLYRLRGEDTFEIREEGLRLLEAWRMAGRPPVDPWLDSSVYGMVRTVSYSGRVPEEWRARLEDRGLADSTGLTDAALLVLDIVPRLERSLVVTKSMARALARAPEGPARKDAYGRFLPVYEAMGLLVGTIPLDPYYSMTLAGRLISRALRRLNLDAPLPSVVNPVVIRALERAEQGLELTPEEKTVLGTLGYLKATGALDYPGRLVLRAVRALRSPQLWPPMALTAEEENLLRAVRDAWREYEEKRVIPGKERIARKYAEIVGQEPDPRWLGTTLLHLESMGLIAETSVEGKQAYKPTEPGEQLAGAPGAGSGAPVAAVKSITYPYAGYSPSVGWVEEAIARAIVAVGGPTARGELLARLSSTSRLPFLTRDEARVLQRVPERKSITVEALGPGAGALINRLEARGLVETLPDGTVRLTEPGRLVKTALLGVPSGIATPITPIIIRVLRAVEKYGTEDVAELVNRTGLTLETVRDALVLARQAKYLGKGGGLTAAGRAVLEAARMLVFTGY